MEDKEIMELYFQRNEDAIRETDRKYRQLCFRIAVNILDSEEDSEECVNDTYLNVWNQIPPNRPGNFMAFLCKITKNLSLKRLDYNRAKKRACESVLPLEELEELLPDERIRPGAEKEEIGRLISEFLCREKADARNVFIRKYWFFDSNRDIVERYSFSEGKVRSMLYHTRCRLREYLRKEGIVI